MADSLTEPETFERGTDLGDEGDLGFEEKWEEAGYLRSRLCCCGVMGMVQHLRTYLEVPAGGATAHSPVLRRGRLRSSSKPAAAR